MTKRTPLERQFSTTQKKPRNQNPQPQPIVPPMSAWQPVYQQGLPGAPAGSSGPEEWRGSVTELALQVAAKFKHLTERERILRFGKAKQARKSSLHQAFAWAVRHYYRLGPQGEQIPVATPHLLEQSLYQSRYPKTKPTP